MREESEMIAGFGGLFEDIFFFFIFFFFSFLQGGRGEYLVTDGRSYLNTESRFDRSIELVGTRYLGFVASGGGTEDSGEDSGAGLFEH